jgi:hypothetical protein
MKDKKELGQLFENNFDCYADEEMAMTKEVFIAAVESEVKEALEAQRVEILKFMDIKIEYLTICKAVEKASAIRALRDEISEALKGDKDENRK